MNRKKALYGLMMTLFASASLGLFILASTEQSLLSAGSPEAAKIGLSELTAQGSGNNKHVELNGFYFGQGFVYATELVQFNDVYIPVFATGEPEDGSHLRVLVWIRNDRNSNEQLIDNRKALVDFVSKFNRAPRAVSGVLKSPDREVRELAAKAYPGVNHESLQLLWARTFPSPRTTAYLWDLWLACLISAIVCGVVFRRQPKTRRS